MSEKTLKFSNITLSKKKIHKYKEPVDLLSVNVVQIAISDIFKYNDESFKYFTGYLRGEISKPPLFYLK